MLPQACIRRLELLKATDRFMRKKGAYTVPACTYKSGGAAGTGHQGTSGIASLNSPYPETPAIVLAAASGSRQKSMLCYFRSVVHLNCRYRSAHHCEPHPNTNSTARADWTTAAPRSDEMEKETTHLRPASRSSRAEPPLRPSLSSDKMHNNWDAGWQAAVFGRQSR